MFANVRWTLGRKLLGLAALGALGTIAVAAVGAVGLSRAQSGMDALVITTRAQRLQMDADMMHDAVRGDVLAAVLGVAAKDSARVGEGRTGFTQHAVRFRQNLVEVRAVTTVTHNSWWTHCTRRSKRISRVAKP